MKRLMLYTVFATWNKKKKSDYFTECKLKEIRLLKVDLVSDIFVNDNCMHAKCVNLKFKGMYYYSEMTYST